MRALFLSLFLVGLAAVCWAGGTVHHDLRVRLDPRAGTLEAEDRVTLPAPVPEVGFWLHRDLRIETDSAELLGDEEGVRVRYRLRFDEPARTFRLRYRGAIRHSLSGPEGYARGFRTTPGLISDEGVYLAGESGWYPDTGDGQVTFRLGVDLPPGWMAVSQGGGEAGGNGPARWTCEAPQDEIFLVAGPWTAYRRPSGSVEMQVYLRQPDPALARKYLEAGGSYLAMYSALLGPYPYPKFALVENFWETGWGMPSFTLLGPRIIRFPFILHSSFPHEILHDWWGNGVFVDYASGNWCEGLTAYLADHLIQEGRGQGAEYRQATLQKYADYAARGRDLALREFTARHSATTEAVGYGKGLMVFHMLRRRLGDEAFVAALRTFYRRNRFRRASWEDVRAAFEQAAGEDLAGFFRAWVDRAGAPDLDLREALAVRRGRRWKLRVSVFQRQPGPAFPLRIPVAVTVEGEPRARWIELDTDGRWARWQGWFDRRPLRVDVDPAYDCFRRLDPGEIPPALSGAFGADRVTVLLPSAADARLRRAYEEAARTWAAGQEGRWEILPDTEPFPEEGAVWILGWENRHRPRFAEAAATHGVVFSDGGVAWDGNGALRPGDSVVLVTRRPGNSAEVVAFAAAPPEALPGLARKLPHYHKYSFLVFEGEEPTNTAKGRWPVSDSPLTAQLADAPAARAKLPRREPLARPAPVFSAQRLRETVEFLAAPEREGRGFGTPGLAEAAEWIARRMAEAGLEPGGDDGVWFQEFRARGGEPEAEVRLRNVVGLVRGTDPELSATAVVVGAHYDHLGRGWPDAHAGDRGRVHPGADDNASGVAVLLELARVVAAARPARSVVFVAFAAEEAGRLGSKQFVAAGRPFPVSRIVAMVNLDTVGRLGGGRLLVLGTGTAREWVHIANGAGYVTGVRVEPVARDEGGSDQVSFVEAGVPAVQLTTGPHPDYHRPTDTPDKIDIDGLVRVAEVAREFVAYLADRREPLTRGTSSGAERSPERSGGRRVTLGVVPDFAFPGPGVRLSGVTPGSPAEAAGLRAGDVVDRVGGAEVRSLADLGRVLKAHRPGDQVEVVFRRGGETKRVEVRLSER
ncbi:M20/M25/M40 family metallo-hydrolase [Deferrisoma camini]|uniref:M20/M25/M40 family metallo-hydrolase n=1 Tax=Deferrisoma camini TaxID=1035120 RepID=UPI0004B3320E|nr:M20/M25/M40 family metallo-hydrolase [Deferrisoma camini]